MSINSSSIKPPIKVAGIGAGYFSQFHYDAWHRMEDVKVVAICNRDPKAAMRIAEKYGIPRVYSDVATMLDEEDIDLVDVIVPPEAHASVLNEVTQRKLNAICQKPFGLNLAEAEQLTQQAEAAGTMLAIHENFRFMPWHRKLKELIHSGVLGEILSGRFYLRTGDGQGPNAYLDRQPYFQTMERLLVHETAIHFVDTFRYLFGEPSSVYADLKRCNPVIKGEDAGILIFNYQDGLTTTFDGNRLLDHGTTNPRRTFGEFWIEGTKATLQLDGEANITLRQFGAEHGEQVEFTWQDQGFAGDCVYSLNRHVVDHLLNGTTLENSARDYLTNIRIEEAIYQSNDEGQRIDLGGSNS